VFITMVACCVLTIAFTALTLGDRRTESGTRTPAPKGNAP
jgi:hypothetical protein